MTAAHNDGVFLRRLMIVFAILGIIVAGYLTYLHVFETTAVLCSEGGGCDTVRDSRYSEVAGGIPVAVIGLVGYISILLVLLFEEFDGPLAEYANILVFGLSLIGVLYSIYLTYLELFIISAICPYCVISALLVLAILAVTIIRLTRQTTEVSPNS